MRPSIGVALVAVSLGLAGCNLFGKKQNGSSPSRPFLGARSTAPAPAPTGGAESASADPSGPLPATSGVLAGSVGGVASSAKVYIQVVDLQEAKAQSAAPMEVESQPGGFFVVQGLKPGRQYKLIARTKEGDRVLAGTTQTRAPNARVFIQLREGLASGDTPPIPSEPSVPGKSASVGSAHLDPPEKTPPGEDASKNGNPAQLRSTGPQWAPPSDSPAGSNSPPRGDPSNIAHGGDKTEGWGGRVPDPPVTVPPQAPPLPPAPSWNSTPFNQSSPPGASAPGPAASPFPGMHLPEVSTPVPSCVVVGNQVENFALNDLNLQPWEFKRQRQGRLVLLDFWRSGCPPCLEAMKHLMQLHQTYGPSGLEIIGIAYMRGSPVEQVAAVRGVRARYGVTYPMLLGAGPSCPVKAQLQVEVYPTLVLLDEYGRILWHSKRNGLGNEYDRRALEMDIRRHLSSR